MEIYRFKKKRKNSHNSLQPYNHTRETPINTRKKGCK